MLCPFQQCTDDTGAVIPCTSPSTAPSLLPVLDAEASASQLPIFIGAGAGGAVVVVVVVVLWRRRVIKRLQKNRANATVAKLDDAEERRRQERLTRMPSDAQS